MDEDYKILKSNNSKELEQQVLEHLANSYQLVGGHQVTTVGYEEYTNGDYILRGIKPNKQIISQAVYRPKPEKKATIS